MRHLRWIIRAYQWVSQFGRDGKEERRSRYLALQPAARPVSSRNTNMYGYRINLITNWNGMMDKCLVANYWKRLC